MRSSRPRRGSWRRHDSLGQLVRAVQIKEFGGPDVLELVDDAPVPEPGERRGPDQGLARGDQLRRHALARELLRREVRAAVHAGRRGRGHARGHGRARGRADRHGRLRGVRGRSAARTRSRCRTGWTTARRSRSCIQGLTAWHLYRTAAKVQPGESVVVHAAAGGVGSLAVQLGKPMGAGRVIATRELGGEARARARAGRRRRGRLRAATG